MFVFTQLPLPNQIFLCTPQGFIDVELVDGKIKEGVWRSLALQDGS